MELRKERWILTVDLVTVSSSHHPYSYWLVLPCFGKGTDTFHMNNGLPPNLNCFFPLSLTMSAKMPYAIVQRAFSPTETSFQFPCFRFSTSASTLLPALEFKTVCQDTKLVMERKKSTHSMYCVNREAGIRKYVVLFFFCLQAVLVFDHGLSHIPQSICWCQNISIDSS